MSPSTAVPTEPTYRLESRLGAGAHGEVWRAVHLASGEAVAIKCVRHAHVSACLRAEAAVLANLDHPSIVEVFELVALASPTRADTPPHVLGTWQEGHRTHRTHDTGLDAGGVVQPGLVMELARGTLGQLQVDAALVAAVAGQLLEAMAAYTARGLVHADIKPGNVLVTADADGTLRLKLTDFALGASAPGRPHRGGTPGFAAPEQRRGEPLGPWTDLYGLGATLAWLAGVDLLETGDVVPANTGAHLGLPPAFASWLARCLAAAPEARFPDPATALAVARGTWLDALEPPRLDVSGAVDGAPPVATDIATAVVVEVRSARRTRTSPPDLEAASPCDLEPRPRLGPSWPERPARRLREAARGAGLGLARMREPAFVGRTTARATLWRTLLEVASSGQLATVSVRGTRGVGKSRLARWLCRTAHETAGVRTLWLDDPSPAAVAASLRLALTTGGRLELPESAVARRITTSCLSPRDVRGDAERGQGLAMAVARWRPSQTRIVVVDIAPGPWTARFIAQLQRRATGVLLLCIGDHGEPGLILEPMPAGDLRAMLRQTVGLRNDLAERIAVRAGGRPGAALSMLRHLVASGHVRPDAGELVLDVAVQQLQADALHARGAAVAAIVERALADRAGALAVVDELSVLGPGACELRGAPRGDALDAVELLADLDVLRASPAGWRIVAPEVLLAWRGTRPDSARVEAATRALDQRATLAPHDPFRRVLSEVRARLLRARPGDPAAALAALATCITPGIQADLIDAIGELCDACERAMPDASDARRLRDQLLVARAGLAFLTGRHDEARHLLARVDVATVTDAELEVGHHEVAAKLALTDARFDEATRLAGQMLARAAAADASISLKARAHTTAGRVGVICRRFDDARAHLEHAIALLAPDDTGRDDTERFERLAMRASAAALLGHAWINDPRPQARQGAVEAVARSRQIALATGSPYLLVQAANDHGEALRALGDLDGAETAYREALELNGDSFPVAGYIHGNLAWVAIARGEHREALRVIDAALARLAPHERTRGWSFLQGIALQPLAALGMTTEWDRAVMRLAEVDHVHAESLAAARAAVSLWRAHGDDPRAAQAETLAQRWSD